MKNLIIICLILLSSCTKGQKPLFTALNTTPSYQHGATMYWQSNTGSIPTGYSSAGSACSANVSAPYSGAVYWNGTLGNGTLLYRYDGYPIHSNGTTGYFYMNGYSFSSSVSSPGQFTVANYAVCGAGTVTFTGSGTYPVMGASGTTGGVVITNNSGATIYIYGGYYSAGASGTVNTSFYFSTVETINLTASTSTYYYTTNYATLTNGSSTGTYSITKNDALGTGAIAKYFYSTTIGGTKIPL